jgi:hypothetical protein
VVAVGGSALATGSLCSGLSGNWTRTELHSSLDRPLAGDPLAGGVATRKKGRPLSADAKRPHPGETRQPNATVAEVVAAVSAGWRRRTSRGPRLSTRCWPCALTDPKRWVLLARPLQDRAAVRCAGLPASRVLPGHPAARQAKREGKLAAALPCGSGGEGIVSGFKQRLDGCTSGARSGADQSRTT